MRMNGYFERRENKKSAVRKCGSASNNRIGRIRDKAMAIARIEVSSKTSFTKPENGQETNPGRGDVESVTKGEYAKGSLKFDETNPKCGDRMPPQTLDRVGFNRPYGLEVRQERRQVARGPRIKDKR